MRKKNVEWVENKSRPSEVCCPAVAQDKIFAVIRIH